MAKNKQRALFLQMTSLKLFMLLLGCKPQGRYTEQHDVFFGIAANLKDLAPDIVSFWPECNGKIHIDAWREVIQVEDYSVEISERNDSRNTETQLFFLNLGGYKQNDFEEYHYKMLVAAVDKGIAVQKARKSAFYKHTGFAGATSHIDDKYGIDVDDIYDIEDILPSHIKSRYTITLRYQPGKPEDPMHLGYLTMQKLAEDKAVT